MGVAMTPTICDEMQERLDLHKRQFGLDVDRWPVKGLPVTLDEWFRLSEQLAIDKAARTGFGVVVEPARFFDGTVLKLVTRVARTITGGWAVKP